MKNELTKTSPLNSIDRDLSIIKDNEIGIGLRSPHHQQVLSEKPEVDWLEIHSENFFVPESAQRRVLDELSESYALSFHGIGLSLGSTDPLNKKHLNLMKNLIDAYKPALISEHVSWSSVDSRYFNDLLPIPYTVESVNLFSDRVNQVQDFLGREIIVENPTTYLAFEESTMHEWEFLNEIQRQSQCGLLLDLNNIYVNSVNLGFDATHYLKNIDISAVKEIHLAGFTRKKLENGEILIDTHGSPVSEPVWELFKQFRQYCSAPALIEWDTNVPELSVLLEQANRARQEQLSAISPELEKVYA